MLSKSRTHRFILWLVGICVLPIALPILIILIWKHPLIALFGCVFAAPSVYHGLTDKRRHRKFSTALDAIIAHHIEDLKRSYAVLVQHDNAGKPVLRKWRAHVDLFLANVARPALRGGNRRMLNKCWSLAVRRVTELATCSLKQKPADLPFSPVLSPSEYEGFCANELRGAGWTVFQTPLVGDQGVDLIAEKDGARVALQCKLYTSPVGNKAVQEIAAGRVHHRARYGVVVTNNRYTDAAKSLASTNRIHLLHHTQLPSLEQILAGKVGQRALFAA
jgi:restriction system protein